MATRESTSMTPAAALARHLEWLEYALSAAREEQVRRRGRLDKATAKNRDRRTVRLAEVTAEVDELAALVQGIKDIQVAAAAAKPAAGSGSKAPAARRGSTKASATKRASTTKRASATSASTRRAATSTGRRGPRRAGASGTKPAAAPADTTAATNGTGPAAAPKPRASSSSKRGSAAKKPAASPKAPATRTRRSPSRRTGSSS
jgi:hypothetical protein